MDDEFKLCWKNFQENIASGFQSLYDRGDLVDVTLACDGKLLQAHKIVLAICSPYFQEIFITNPCKHPIIILKDVSYTIMCELLEFMYQGVVNVKHTELQAFMKIGQLLQIKGLATNSSSAASSISDKSNINHNANAENDTPPQPSSSNLPKAAVSPQDDAVNNNENANNPDKPALANSSSNTPQRTQSPVMSPASPSLNISSNSQKTNDSQLHHSFHLGSGPGGPGHKRHLPDFNSDSLSIYSRNKVRRSLAPTEHGSENNDGSEVGGSSSLDQMNTEDFFTPHISMVETRYDLNNVKRENTEHHLHPNSPSAAAAAAAAASLRNSFNSAAFGLDYTFYKNNSGPAPSGQEYPNDLNISGDFSKGFANHMDIPPNCPNVVMLSSTSLMHGHCVFNRNNTVATQQGMKTYWLCKSYRISMCRARCITHQGKIISATGVHNHPPHMRAGTNGGVANNIGSLPDGNMSGGSGGNVGSNNHPQPTHPSSGGAGGGLRFAQNIASPSANMFQPSFYLPHHGHPMSPPTPPTTLQHAMSAAEATALNPTSSHHFVSMPNQTTQLLPPTTVPNLSLQPPQPNNGIPTIMHGSEPQTHAGYDMSPPSSTDHNRTASHHIFDTNDKSLKVHLKDDHISVQNAAELSPSNMHGNDDRDHQRNKPTSEHQQHQHQHQHHQHQPVQVIDSITISPGGNAHNFKMEPL